MNNYTKIGIFRYRHKTKMLQHIQRKCKINYTKFMDLKKCYASKIMLRLLNTPCVKHKYYTRFLTKYINNFFFINDYFTILEHLNVIA